MNLYDRVYNKLKGHPRPRRAMHGRIRRGPLLIMVVAALGLIGILTAAAVTLPPRIAADNSSIAAPVESPETTAAESPSALVTAEPRHKSSPKPQKSTKSTETRRVASPEPKPTPPPKVIGTRYACTVLRVRVEPGLSAKIVKTVTARTKIRIMNRTVGDKWRMVRFEKKNRWMYEPCLWKKPPPKPKPAPSPAPKKEESKSSESPKPKSSAPRVSSGSVWDKLANCESSGNWSINTGNGYYGGLQFTLSTWRAYGGDKYASYAYQATRAEQIAIATKVRDARGGYGDWPACSKKLGLPQ